MMLASNMDVVDSIRVTFFLGNFKIIEFVFAASLPSIAWWSRIKWKKWRNYRTDWVGNSELITLQIVCTNHSWVIWKNILRTRLWFGSVRFGGRVLFARILQSAGSDIYFTLLLYFMLIIDREKNIVLYYFC